MIKRIVALLLFSAIIIIGIVLNAYLKDSSENLSKVLDNAINSIYRDDYTSASEYINDLKTEWNKRTGWLELMIEHAEIDNVFISIGQISSHIKEKDKKLFLSEAAHLSFLFEHIFEKNKLSANNIF